MTTKELTGQHCSELKGRSLATPPPPPLSANFNSRQFVVAAKLTQFLCHSRGLSERSDGLQEVL